MRKRRREGGCNNKDKELWINPKRFFKIILHRTLQYKTLRIPAAFAKEFSPRLPTQATITIQTGLSWKVALEKIENELCFAEGMAEFMEQNGIELGYFLEFEYQGYIQFNVCIFDLSCTEIDYPTTYDQYANVNERVEVEAEKDMHRDDIVLEHNNNNNNNNPSFTITVQNYNVSGYSYLHIPQGFIDEHLEVNLYKSKKSKTIVTLQRGNGREWHVSCYVYKKSIRLSGPQWKEFILDNNWYEHQGEEYTFVLVHKTSSSVTFEVIKE